MEIVRSKTAARLIVAGVVVGVTAAGLGHAKAGPSPSFRAFEAEADTYISEAAPRRNFGRARSLRSDSAPRVTTYLRFRVRKIKGEFAGVTLLLKAQGRARAGYEVRRIEDNEWREAQLTYATAPKLSLRYASSKPVRRGAWSAVDVTTFVRRGGGRVSLAITTKSPLGVLFASRETEQGPRLVVRTNEDTPEP